MVTLCYLFVDRPVAFFVHDHGISHHPLFRWLTYPPPLLEDWTPIVLVLLVIRRARGPFTHAEMALLAGCLALIVAEQFREGVSFLAGRYWPDTWIENNPSLIGDGAYGFHPFHSGPWYSSFPSGHTGRSASIAAVVWIAYPRWRWLAGLGVALVVLGLLGMNYHFVSDIIAGGCLGSLVGAYMAALVLERDVNASTDLGPGSGRGM